MQYGVTRAIRCGAGTTRHFFATINCVTTERSLIYFSVFCSGKWHAEVF